MSKKTTNDKKRSVKRFLIQPEYQMRYVFMIVMVGAILTSLNAFVFYMFTRSSYVVLSQAVPLHDSTRVQLLSILERNTSALSISVFVMMIALVLAAVYISHRAAGPVYQLQKLFRAVKEGDLSVRAHFRRDDEFKTVAEDFNAMMVEIEKLKHS